jgi:hypothetical protein
VDDVRGAGVRRNLVAISRGAVRPATFVQVFVLLFGMLFTGVLAIAAVLFCFKLFRRAISRLK